MAISTSVLLTCEDLGKGFGAEPLFEGLKLTLFEGDHIGLVGPNGAGKSTLLKVLAGLEVADSGSRALRKGIRIGYVPQDPVFAPGRSVEEIVAEAVAARQDQEEYERFQSVVLALGKAGFEDRETATETLSGGWRKRLAIARELAQGPDILLLDEPTNHLDVEGILWLESLLTSEPKAFIVVSHDRYFLQSVARRMIELDRIYPEGLLQVNGSYVDFLEKRDEILRHQKAYQDSLANRVRKEVEWLRRGPKARTSKSKARISTAERLIDELGESRSRSRVATAAIDFTSSERRSKRLWQAEGLKKTLGDQLIVEGLDLLLRRGSRLGVLGKNGSGKTTLLRMIVGELEPDAGRVEKADSLRIVYFEQNRESLDPSVTLRRALAPEGDSVVYRDCSVHVASWARRFLFRAEQLDTKVSQLSGGEKARIVLARLMLRPADLLVLDEPTNDLDIPTLEILEESLLEFSGALVLVTHDRFLLDRVSTEILALDGGRGALFADYGQWESRRRQVSRKIKTKTPKKREKASQSKRLTYREQVEWDGMEERLLAAEKAAEEAGKLAEDPFIQSDAESLQKRCSELADSQSEVDRLYARWAELEEKLQ